MGLNTRCSELLRASCWLLRTMPPASPAASAPRSADAEPGGGPIRALASIRGASYDALIDMDTVTLSPKFQVVIPQAIREALHLTAGEKLRVLRYADRVEFIPVRPIQQMRGFLRGMDTTIEREDDRL
jgi:AbrB family looped-hinge helix DNA binding protein